MKSRIIKSRPIFLSKKYLLLFTFSCLFAQAPDVLWEQTYGGDSSDGGVSVCRAADNGHIVAGYTNSFGNGDYDICLYRVDSIGTLLWTKTIGGINYDIPNEMQPTSDSGYIIIGRTTSFGPGTPNYSNIYLIKINSNGDTIWTKVFGGVNSEEGLSVSQTTDGGYILVGRTASFGAGGADVYLIKTNAAGDTTWTRTYGGALNDIGWSVQQTTDGGYIISGSTLSFGAGSSDVYFIKTDDNGALVWSRTYGGAYSERGWSVQQTDDGGYMIVGYTYSFGIGTPNSYNSYFIRTNANGDTIWTKAINEPDYDWMEKMERCLDGGFIATGSTYSIPPSACQVYIIKITTDGVIVWEKRQGSGINDMGHSIRRTGDGGYIVVGIRGEGGANNPWDAYLFKINMIKLITPNGGEVWPAGSLRNISWSCENPTISSYTVLFSRTGGNAYLDTIATGIPGNSTTLLWRLPLILCNTCRVKIQAFNSLGNFVGEDPGDANFAIVDSSPPCSFNLISPADSCYLAILRPTLTWHATFDSVSGLKNYGLYINDTLRHLGIDTSWIVNYSLREAAHTWHVFANDSAGNARRSNETWTMIIDTTAPIIGDLIAPLNYQFLADSTISFIWHGAFDNLSGIDHYLLQYTTDSTFIIGVVETTLVDTVCNKNLSDTIYYWRVRCYDKANNASRFSSIWQFGIGVDTIPPLAPTLIAPINGVILNIRQVNFEWSPVIYRTANKSSFPNTINNPGDITTLANAPIRYIIQIDTQLNFISPLFVDTLDGTTAVRNIFEHIYFYWRVKAFDWAGNQGPYANPDSFGINAAPLIESTTVWIDTTFAGPFEITSKVTDLVSGVDSVILYYQRNADSNWVLTVMEHTANQNWYIDTIPEADSTMVDTIKYYLEAKDSSGLISCDPPGAPVNYYLFLKTCLGFQEIKTSLLSSASFLVNNPSLDKLTIKVNIPTGMNISLSIYDICGRLMKKEILIKNNRGQYEIGGGLNAGVYLILININNRYKIEKAVFLK